MAGPILVLTGGGVKGAVTAARWRDEHDVVLLHIDYGQSSAAAERNAVCALADALPTARALALQHPNGGWLEEQLAAWCNRGAPRSSPAQRTQRPAALINRHVMPFLLSTAVPCAVRINASVIAIGVSRWVDSSHVGLPALDGRPSSAREFIHSFGIMYDNLLGGRSPLQWQAPLMDITYDEILKLATRFGVPLAKTWTCTRARQKPCGRCDACRARAAAASAPATVIPEKRPTAEVG